MPRSVSVPWPDSRGLEISEGREKRDTQRAALILKKERAYEAPLTTPRWALNVSTRGHQSQVSGVETSGVPKWKLEVTHNASDEIPLKRAM